MRKPAPLCAFRELEDGTYSLDRLADMHEAMDEQDEYEARWNDWADEQRETEKET